MSKKLKQLISKNAIEDTDYFSKDFYNKCIRVEVYKNNRHSFLDKIWAKYFKPETNSVYLVRKYLYKVHSSPKGLSCRLLRKKLMTKYGIHVSTNTRIGLGLDIRHPSTIMITNATIGKNCILFHNVTIGAKYEEANADNSPIIGDNVTFFSNSACYGKIRIANNVRLGSYCCAFCDISEPGVYIGIGKRIKKIG